MTPSSQSIGVNESKLTASICRESFFDFVKEFWDVIIPEKPHWNWHIEYLCEELQIVAERVFEGKPKLYDLIINISPGTTKSTIASVMYLPWCWTRMPTLRSINGSHTYELVLDLSRRSRDILLSKKYQSCFPNIKIKEDHASKHHFGNTLLGTRFCCTVAGKTPTGMHGHIHVIDDPIDPKKAISDAELNSANTWMSETLSTRKVDKAVTPLVLIMQRLAQNDPAGFQMTRPGKKKLICLPAELTEHVQPRELRRRYIDGLMDPVRLSREVLEEFKQEGDYFYAGQFLQHPVPLGGGMFKTEMLHCMENNNVEFPPGLDDFKRIVRYWDNAGSPKKKDKRRAYTVGIKMGLDRWGRVWVLDVIRVRLNTAARERLKLQTARVDGKYKVEIVQEQEGGSGGQESAENTIRNLAGYRVRIDIPKGDKELRADPFSSQVNGGNVYLAPGAWNKDYIEEMKFFPFSTYKDQVDGSSGAFASIFSLKRKVGLVNTDGIAAQKRAPMDRLSLMASRAG